MNIIDIKETRIVGVTSDPLSSKQTTKRLNQWLEAGWVLIHCYTRDANDSSGPDGFPAFVIGWPHRLPAIEPKE